jgi:hypothetical protein
VAFLFLVTIIFLSNSLRYLAIEDLASESSNGKTLCLLRAT